MGLDKAGDQHPPVEQDITRNVLRTEARRADRSNAPIVHADIDQFMLLPGDASIPQNRIEYHANCLLPCFGVPEIGRLDLWIADAIGRAILAHEPAGVDQTKAFAVAMQRKCHGRTPRND